MNGLDGDGVFRQPPDRYLVTFPLKVFSWGRVEVLANDLEPSAPLKFDGKPGDRPRVGDVGDGAALGVKAIRSVSVDEPYLLGPAR